MKMFDFEKAPVKLRLFTALLIGFLVCIVSYLFNWILDDVSHEWDHYAFFFVWMSVLWFFVMPYTMKEKK